MQDPHSPSRGRLLVRLIVALAALLLAWLTDPEEFEGRPPTRDLGASARGAKG